MHTRNEPALPLPVGVAVGARPVDVIVCVPAMVSVQVPDLVASAGGGEMVLAAPLMVVTVGVTVVPRPTSSTEIQGLGEGMAARGRCAARADAEGSMAAAMGRSEVRMVRIEGS